MKPSWRRFAYTSFCGTLSQPQKQAAPQPLSPAPLYLPPKGQGFSHQPPLAAQPIGIHKALTVATRCCQFTTGG